MVKFKAKLIPNFPAIKLDWIAIFVLSTLMSVCISSKAISQPDTSLQNQLPPQITIGIRNPAKSIGRLKESGTWGGFCYVFGQKLQNQLRKDEFETKVVFYKEELKNVYGGRYEGLKLKIEGLKLKIIDIECGPNTILNEQQLANKNWEHVSFSDSFHTTGIKLLLTRGTYTYLNNFSGKELKEKIRKIGIAVVKETTTYNKLKAEGYNPIPYGTRQQALLQLEDNPTIQAYASDALILKTILRKDYEDENYTLFPQEPNQYLPDIDTEEYGMAILKDTSYEKVLLEEISNTLDSMEQEKEKLKQEESAKSIEQIKEEYHQIIDEQTEEYHHKLDEEKNKKSVSMSLFYSVIVIVAILTFVIQWFFMSRK